MSDAMQTPPGGAEPSFLAALSPSLGAPPAPPAEQLTSDPGPNRAHSDLLMRWASMPNIADELNDDELREIAQHVVRDHEIDDVSRAEWKAAYAKWIKVAMQVADEKTYPWPMASNIIYPLITSAAIQFAARAYPAIIRDQDVVKGAVVGDDNGIPAIDPRTGQPAQGQNGAPVWKVQPGVKKTRADKIGRHMSWQLLDEQEEWEPQTDKLLITLPIVGSVFRKSYFDPTMQRNVSETVSAMDLVVNYHAKSFETAPRYTELVKLYPWEVEEMIRAGVYLEDDYGQDEDAGEDVDFPTTFLEQHRRWDLDGDGYPEPYIVTVARDSHKLARIRAAYDPEGVFYSREDHQVRKIDAIGYYTKYGFIPSPDGGVYDVGFGSLLFPINEAINSTLNQMFDAGHLANTGGGFIGSNMSMNTGAVRFAIGEYKPVTVTGGNIRDAIYSMPWPGPSPVLFELLKFLVEAGKEVAAVKDIMTGDMPGDNTSGITTLAVIEQGLKVFSAIYKRIHRSLKLEFRKLARLNRLYLPPEAGFRIGNEWYGITRADYEQGAGVEPISDPQMLTDMQRLGKAQFLGQFKDDAHFDGLELRRRMLDAAQIPNAESLLVSAPPPNPALMVKTSELALKGETLKIRAAHEQDELDIRRGKDKAAEIETLSRAILNLANAAKADHDVNQQWYVQHLATLRLQMDALNAAAERNSPADSPADAAGIGSGTGTGASPGAPGGNDTGNVQPMAQPSGQPGGAPVPG